MEGGDDGGVDVAAIQTLETGEEEGTEREDVTLLSSRLTGTAVTLEPLTSPTWRGQATVRGNKRR